MEIFCQILTVVLCPFQRYPDPVTSLVWGQSCYKCCWGGGGTPQYPLAGTGVPPGLVTLCVVYLLRFRTEGLPCYILCRNIALGRTLSKLEIKFNENFLFAGNTLNGALVCNASCDCATENCKLMLLANPGLKSTGWNVCEIKLMSPVPETTTTSTTTTTTSTTSAPSNYKFWLIVLLIFSIPFFHCFLFKIIMMTPTHFVGGWYHLTWRNVM